MANFVLVGGAWLGGDAWDEVVNELRARGHEVYPLTLPGLGDRQAEATPETDLDAYVADATAQIESERVDDVILVGHSYSGIVVTGVADRIPVRLRALVYCDSAPFSDGEAYVDVMPPAAREGLRATVDAYGDGWMLPVPDLAAFGASTRGLDDQRRASLLEKMAPQPFATWTQPLRLQGTNRTYRRVVIACDDMRGMVAAGIPRMVELTREPWEWIDIETGHWPMASAPGELAAALQRIAS
jgi:pimeloyl-ACP methyl ester carboxylesterase